MSFSIEQVQVFSSSNLKPVACGKAAREGRNNATTMSDTAKITNYEGRLSVSGVRQKLSNLKDYNTI